MQIEKLNKPTETIKSSRAYKFIFPMFLEISAENELEEKEER